MVPSTDPRLEPFVGQWAALLRTRKRDGSWVGTPVNVAVERDRAYVGTAASTAKVKRLRNFADADIAPCTPRGRPTGPAQRVRARRLEGREADAAQRRLQRKHRIVYGLVVPLELRLRRTPGVFYELTPI
jgi:uncharacterized protein